MGDAHGPRRSRGGTALLGAGAAGGGSVEAFAISPGKAGSGRLRDVPEPERGLGVTGPAVRDALLRLASRWRDRMLVVTLLPAGDPTVSRWTLHLQRAAKAR